VRGGFHLGKEKDSQCPDNNHLETFDDFCIPIEQCPDLLNKEKLPSPTTCLNKQELERLEERIHLANRLLIDLAVSLDHFREKVVIPSQLEKAMKGLKGKKISVEVNCESNKEDDILISGMVTLAGKDFLQIIDEAKINTIVPYHVICEVNSNERIDDVKEGKALLKLESCVRRELTFNFGNTVTSSPELFAIFFGRSLIHFLKSLINSEITVHNEGQLYTGILEKVTEEDFSIKIKDSVKTFSPSDICLISY
jgi:hypothetical protein